MGSHIFGILGGKKILANRDFGYKKMGRFAVKNLLPYLVLLFKYLTIGSHHIKNIGEK